MSRRLFVFGVLRNNGFRAFTVEARRKPDYRGARGEHGEDLSMGGAQSVVIAFIIRKMR